MAIKPRKGTQKDIDKLNEQSLSIAREIYQCQPFVTKVWFKMNTKFPHKWIDDNWEKIIK